MALLNAAVATGLEKEIVGEIAPAAERRGEGEVTPRVVDSVVDVSVFVLLYFEMGGKGLPLAARRARC